MWQQQTLKKSAKPKQIRRFRVGEKGKEEVFIPSIIKARSKIEGLNIDKEQLKKIAQKRLDVLRMFKKVFNSKEGKVVLAEIETLARHGYPDYENEKFHYAKTGQIELVEHINKLLTTKEK